MSNAYESPDKWYRVLFMILFYIIFNITEFVIAGVAVVQCGFVLITGNTNQFLLGFGDSLSRYARDILKFVTFNTDEKPFPFKEFPPSDIATTVS